MYEILNLKPKQQMRKDVKNIVRAKKMNLERLAETIKIYVTFHSF